MAAIATPAQTVATASTQTTKHPYFLTERKKSEFKAFFTNPKTESMNDIAKKAREWRLEQGDKIEVIGHAWSYQPDPDPEKKGPSSYVHVLTITYVEKEEGSNQNYRAEAAAIQPPPVVNISSVSSGNSSPVTGTHSHENDDKDNNVG